jgi:hypothetical protein
MTSLPGDILQIFLFVAVFLGGIRQIAGARG